MPHEPSLTSLIFPLISTFVLTGFMCILPYKMHFFSLSPFAKPAPLPHTKAVKDITGLEQVRFWHVLVGFFLYIGVGFILPYGAFFFPPQSAFDSFFGATLFLINVFVTLALFWIFFKSRPSPFASRVFWSNKPMTRERCLKDILVGAGSWFIAFPAALFVSQIAYTLVMLFFSAYKAHAQLAIHHLKSTSSNPLLYVLTLICFAFLVPIIEETLFRGLLLSWIKNITRSRGWAIALSGIIFGAFHYSTSQGITNLELVSSLMLLGVFLGFVYEKQGSLIASISLHATFNTIALIRIIVSG